MCSKNKQELHKCHWQATKRILCYLKDATHMGIHYSTNTPILLHDFSNTHWASDLDWRKTTSGYLFTLGYGPISWCSKKQYDVDPSSTKVEYVSIALADKHLAWMWMILDQLIFLKKLPLLYFVTKQAPFILFAIIRIIRRQSTLIFGCTTLDSSILRGGLYQSLSLQSINLPTSSPNLCSRLPSPAYGVILVWEICH
jgi:hypothetical protein